MSRELTTSLRKNMDAFGVSLTDEQIERLSAYHAIVERANPLLHLVAPCRPDEFATRHILESLLLLQHLSKGAHIADVGAGAGLPSLPCVLVRDDLQCTLIESKEKKAAFLNETVEELGLQARVQVANSQFSETDIADCGAVTSRALDKFADRLPQLLRWAKDRTILLFGGENLAERLTQLRRNYSWQLMPLSERRFLYALENQRDVSSKL